ncbi:MAG: hypothetical protein FJ276_00975 [Planctomycetes bacterium]|nr:hypothetical protein [Planctomycetota bacterium]
MVEAGPMDRYARQAARDAAVARRRSLTRRLGGPLFWKYVQVVPSVFTARGEFAAFELHVPDEQVIAHLSRTAVLTLDSATERLGGFRFGRGRHIYAYFETVPDLDSLVGDAIGRRLAGDLMPLLLAPQEGSLLLAVVCRQLPPHVQATGCRIVTHEYLVRDLIGFYGLRHDLLVAIENNLGKSLV